jgi:predicted RNase H-like HicB family nuclease
VHESGHRQVIERAGASVGEMSAFGTRRRAGGTTWTVSDRPGYPGSVELSIELDREDDGRWIAEALELPGVMTYGSTREEAIGNTEKLAIEVIADRITHGELPHSALSVSFRVLSEQLAGG